MFSISSMVKAMFRNPTARTPAKSAPRRRVQLGRDLNLEQRETPAVFGSTSIVAEQVLLTTPNGVFGDEAYGRLNGQAAIQVLDQAPQLATVPSFASSPIGEIRGAAMVNGQRVYVGDVVVSGNTTGVVWLGLNNPLLAVPSGVPSITASAVNSVATSGLIGGESIEESVGSLTQPLTTLTGHNPGGGEVATDISELSTLVTTQSRVFRGNPTNLSSYAPVNFIPILTNGVGGTAEYKFVSNWGTRGVVGLNYLNNPTFESATGIFDLTTGVAYFTTDGAIQDLDSFSTHSLVAYNDLLGNGHLTVVWLDVNGSPVTETLDLSAVLGYSASVVGNGELVDSGANEYYRLLVRDNVTGVVKMVQVTLDIPEASPAPTTYIGTSSGRNVTVTPSSGAASSSSAFTLSFPLPVVQFAVGDVRGNGGAPDVAAVMRSGGNTRIIVKDGETGATIFDRTVAGHLPYGDVAIGDINGDGKGDVAVATRQSLFAWVYTFDGATGTQLAAPRLVTVLPTAPTRITLKDVNGDGRADLGVEGQTIGARKVVQFWAYNPSNSTFNLFRFHFGLSNPWASDFLGSHHVWVG